MSDLPDEEDGLEEVSRGQSPASSSGEEEGNEKAQPVEVDPLFDPEADDRDEAYIAKQRKGKDSDAILSCPSCFATLSIACQQHEKYHNQFRAIFVMNCRVEASQLSQDGSRGGRGSSKRQKQQDGNRQQQPQPAQAAAGSSAASSANVCRPVVCDICGTEVGAFEEAEEVYHFFHVLASQS